MIYGLDLLASAKYPKIAVNNVPQGWFFGVFGNVDGFGAGIRVVKRFLLLGGVNVRVQMLWSDAHKFTDKDIPRIRKMARVYNAIALANPQATIYLSPFCEHQLSNPDKYLDIVAAEAPNCIPVNTPMAGGAFSDKYINEVHGNKNAPAKGKYFYSYDGLDSVDDDVTKMKEKHKKAAAFFFWDHNFNRKFEKGDNTPRPKRQVKPSKQVIESVAFLHTDRGAVNLPKGWLWKSHAEHKSWPTAPREHKPVLLAKVKAPDVKLFDSAGNLVAHAQRDAKPFHDGRWVYRFAKWGYQISQDAINFTGSPRCRLVLGGKEYGFINPAFRFQG
jgi:hypothetical protein